MAGNMKLTTQQLMDRAFGRRLLEGEDEWLGVADVVRLSFLLLYRELRRLAKREARVDDERVLLLSEQTKLLRQEIQLIKNEVHTLRSACALAKTRKCVTCSKEAVQKQVSVQVAEYARVHVQRHENLRRKVIKLQSRLRAARRVQHECEEIVVRTAELHQRQVQQLSKRLREQEMKRQALEVQVCEALIPKVKQMENRVATLKLQSTQRDWQRKMDEYNMKKEELSGDISKHRVRQQLPIQLPVIEKESHDSHLASATSPCVDGTTRKG